MGWSPTVWCEWAKSIYRVETRTQWTHSSNAKSKLYLLPDKFVHWWEKHNFYVYYCFWKDRTTGTQFYFNFSQFISLTMKIILDCNTTYCNQSESEVLSITQWYRQIQKNSGIKKKQTVLTLYRRSRAAWSSTIECCRLSLMWHVFHDQSFSITH